MLRDDVHFQMITIFTSHSPSQIPNVGLLFLYVFNSHPTLGLIKFLKLIPKDVVVGATWGILVHTLMLDTFIFVPVAADVIA